MYSNMGDFDFDKYGMEYRYYSGINYNYNMGSSYIFIFNRSNEISKDW